MWPSNEGITFEVVIDAADNAIMVLSVHVEEHCGTRPVTLNGTWLTVSPSSST